MNRWEGLDEFVAVAECGQFSAAAKRLGLSNSQVSRQVAQLEERLQTRLFYRSTRKVSLTAEGSDYLRRARRILDEVADAEETLRGMRSKPQGRLRVDVPVSFGRYLLLPALPGLRGYRETLRRITAASNSVLCDVVEELVHVCRDGASASPSRDALGSQCRAFVGELVSERDAYMLRNQVALLAALEPDGGRPVVSLA